MKRSFCLFLFLIMAVHHGTVFCFSIFDSQLWGEDEASEDSVYFPIDAGEFKEDFPRANEQFALKLMQVLEKETNNSANVFISPFSIGLAMAVAMVGANGDTYSQMYRTLGFSSSLTRNQFPTGYQQLLSQLNDTVDLANAIAVRPGISISSDYLTKLQDNFSSKLFNTVDREQINQWCTEKTRGMIKDIAPKEPVAVALLNAVFFKSKWKTPFSRLGYTENFYIKPSEKISIRFMQIKEEYFAYAQFDDGQLLELPYKHKNVSMFVFLPSGHLNSEISAVLRQNTLSSRISQMHSRKVHLKMPSFKFESSYQLRKHLVALGTVDAFSSRADFGRMFGETKLALSSVVHKATIEVDEEGTTAAVATIVSPWLSAQPQPISVILNRPFIFFIREQNNGAILFSGVVRNP